MKGNTSHHVPTSYLKPAVHKNSTQLTGNGNLESISQELSKENLNIFLDFLKSKVELLNKNIEYYSGEELNIKALESDLSIIQEILLSFAEPTLNLYTSTDLKIVKFLKHDICNIFTPLKGYTEFLFLPDEGSRNQFIDIINTEKKKLKDLLFNENIVIDVAYKISRIISTFDQKINIEQGDWDIKIRSKVGDFTRVIDNLITNSLEHGGVENVNIKISIKKHDGFVTIEIKDNGKGIPKEDLDQIFQNGFTTKGISGTGIALASSFEMVSSLGGVFKVKNNEGEPGVTFSFTLPEEKKLSS